MKEIILNGIHFALSHTDLKIHPERYAGFVRRYKNKMELYNQDGSPLGCINCHGVLFGMNVNNGKKSYRFLFHDDPLNAKLGRALLSDLYLFRVHENYIDTIPDGGIFSAFPDHTYNFQRGE